MSSGKSIEEYRRDIFALKGKLKAEEEYLAELRQKYADLEVGGETSYTFAMKAKILECKLGWIQTHSTIFVSSCLVFQIRRRMSSTS